jgi:hypothetical protein
VGEHHTSLTAGQVSWLSPAQHETVHAGSAANYLMTGAVEAEEVHQAVINARRHAERWRQLVPPALTAVRPLLAIPLRMPNFCKTVRYPGYLTAEAH